MIVKWQHFASFQGMPAAMIPALIPERALREAAPLAIMPPSFSSVPDHD
jgi:hypothetical protein